MNRRKSTSLFIILLEFYYFLGWIYIYNSYALPQERFDVFQSKLFLGLNLSFVNLGMMGLAIISILLSAAFKNGFVRTLIMFINLSFLIFLFWQHL